jgi:predicted transcriptional regulator
MPCISADGKPTPTAKQVLTSLQGGKHALEDIALAVGLPLFRIRSSMRELVAAGWVRPQADGTYELSEKGLEILGNPPS